MRVGPACHQNWVQSEKGAPPRAVFEVPIYSDAWMIGEAKEGVGPYKILNGLAASPFVDPALVVIVESHLDPNDYGPLNKTDVTTFTGASLFDEIAALLSLAMGTRLVAGNVTRFLLGDEWRIVGDTGRPTLWQRSPGPNGAASPLTRQRIVLPRVVGQKSISAGDLSLLPKLSSDAATTLVRAARSYRDALWIAEAEPDLAWLLFVSALEAAAVQHHTAKLDAVEVLRSSKEELANDLDAIDHRATRIVAEAIADQLRATARFLSFAGEFMPPAPPDRPSQGFQIEWSPENLRRCMKTVYDHRSKALHTALPFPPPMCEAPESGDPIAGHTEAPMGHSTASLNGVWTKKDCPIHLHTFEYIVRGLLLAWWKSLGPKPDFGGSGVT